MSSCASAACLKLSILGLGIEDGVSEGPEIPDPVKMGGFTSSEPSVRSSRLEPEVLGRAEGLGGQEQPGTSGAAPAAGAVLPLVIPLQIAVHRVNSQQAALSAAKSAAAHPDESFSHPESGEGSHERASSAAAGRGSVLGRSPGYPTS